jgi:hypothetical protein
MAADIQKIRAFFGKEKTPEGRRVTRAEAKTELAQDFNDFCDKILRIRNGYRDDNNVEVPPSRASFGECLKERYGEEATPKEYLRAFGVYYNTMNLQQATYALGGPELSTKEIAHMLQMHTSFASSTRDYSSEYKFFIPELIVDAIDMGYRGAGVTKNWIALEQPMGNDDEITMPHIKLNVGMPSRIGEGANIPKSKMQVGQKKASNFKVGEGFEFTYELLSRVKIPLMAKTMMALGQKLVLGRDSERARVLYNGEQASGTESAAVIGVEDTSKGFQAVDIKRVVARLKRLGFNVDRMVTGEDDGINISNLPEFKGFSGVTKEATLRNILGLPPALEVDTYICPPDQICLFDSQNTLIDLTSRGYLIEQEGEPSKQTVNLWITDRLGNAIFRRDARVLIDKSIPYATNGFPSWMDIDAYINQSFTL